MSPVEKEAVDRHNALNARYKELSLFIINHLIRTADTEAMKKVQAIMDAPGKDRPDTPIFSGGPL